MLDEQVESGMDVVKLIEKEGTFPHGRTRREVKVSDCGVVDAPAADAAAPSK